MRLAEQIAGALIVMLALVDVLLVVLYARIGSGFIGPRVARFVWMLFRYGSKPFGRRRGTILSFAGPFALLSLLAVWFGLLTVGTALIVHPHLGTGVVSKSGPTPTDFVTALFASGPNVAILGTSDLGPATSAFRLFYLFNAIIAMSVLSLTVTYLLEVYNGLQNRNTMGLKLHLQSGETGDAAELLAGLGAEGNFDHAFSTLTDIAVEVSTVKESHHFYPVLFYFRFAEPYYSVSRTTLLMLDTVTLIKTVLDDERYAALKESLAIAQLWRAALLFVKLLEKTFLHGAKDGPTAPDAATEERWRRRYAAACRRLREAKIGTIADERAGADEYVRMRAEWDAHVKRLAAAGMFELAEVDPMVADPEQADRRPPFRGRLHAI